jgi:hypothetical protein
MAHSTTARRPKAPSKRAPRPETATAAESFDWPLANDAEAYLRRQLATFQERNVAARQLAQRMRDETGTDFFEWTDHLVLSINEEKALADMGFERDPQAEAAGEEGVYEHPLSTLPRVLLRRGLKQSPCLVSVRPEFVADFMACNNIPGEPEGEPCSRLRRILVAEENGTRLEAVERRAYRGFLPAPLNPGESSRILKARELLHTRHRHFANDAEGFKLANQVLDRVIGLVGRDLACQFFFEAERVYWERRNGAGRIQKLRQDRLGLGWGNHDHHTFRCSRDHFVDLVEFLLKLGFAKRERYYAGAEAGWGAQISEQPVTGVVVFADVDLLPEETHIDFSTHKLPPAPRLGTVGLWVGLHGESFLDAGMHHLEARFEFDLLRDQLLATGVSTMKPFSDFAFLRQAFTEGERWPVNPKRLELLLAAGMITWDQFSTFLKEGAIGSHLENLQRHGGFKGFNQQSVSAVIAATDPRKSHFQSASA